MTARERDRRRRKIGSVPIALFQFPSWLNQQPSALHFFLLSRRSLNYAHFGNCNLIARNLVIVAIVSIIIVFCKVHVKDQLPTYMILLRFIKELEQTHLCLLSPPHSMIVENSTPRVGHCLR